MQNNPADLKKIPAKINFNQTTFMKSRRQFIRTGSLAATVLLATKPFQGLAKYSSFVKSIANNGTHLTILHTANIQAVLHASNGLGGFKNTAKTIEAVKDVSHNALLLDTGNFLSGNVSDHQELFPLLKRAGYDAMLPSKNDLKHEATNELPVLDNLQPYHIIQKGKIRIGIIAATTGNQLFTSSTIGAINALAASLKSTHQCNLVICLSDLGYKNTNNVDDVTLATSSEHIDVIIGNEPELCMKTPTIKQNINKHEVIINHIGKAGVVLGRMDFAFDENNQKKEVVFDNLMIGTPGNRWKKTTA